MNSYYKVKVSYNSVNENNQSVTVKEVYVVSAVSVADAEEKMYGYLDNVDDLRVIDVTSMKNLTAILSQGEHAINFYKVVIKITTIDESTGKEKDTTCNYLVYADALKCAYDEVYKELKDSTYEYSFYSVCETNIVDVVN